eukprot:5893841-Prymnesium_polylepis.1
MMRCMQLLRDHCLGEREVNIELVSDPASNFHSKYWAAYPTPRACAPGPDPDAPRDSTRHAPRRAARHAPETRGVARAPTSLSPRSN